MLIPELQEFQRLFAQMDILQQKLMKFWSRDTLICNNVLGSGSPTPPGVEFWRIKIRFYPPGHRKNEKRTTVRFAGSSLCEAKIKVSKKVRILDGLFDTFGVLPNQRAHQTQFCEYLECSIALTLGFPQPSAPQHVLWVNVSVPCPVFLFQ